ncbi:unnamed protein product [Nesidiocoris tenuis]|uniref:Uncharacterized protein n=1 Tax=Nesidiocoris tenuis TaxID=355587 RepID=A0A6H5HST2_9HEMI|nr:unnamed protein product [Nesidiocoris tenuis]
MSATSDVFVPEWKRELIRKKQLWKNRGGWSVPPVARHQSDGFARVTDGFRKQTDVRKSTTDLSNIDMISTDDDYEDVFPLVKTRSAENILDEKPSNKQRRVSSTTSYENYAKKTRPVPTMEEFFRKYRKSPARKTTVLEKKSPDEIFEKSNWKQSAYPLFFVDMNRNELPQPDIVKKTVKAFEGSKGVDSTDGIERSTSETSMGDTSADDSRSSIRDVVDRFEAKIRSSQTKAPTTAKSDVSPTPVARKSKHVTFETDVRLTNGVFNGRADDGQSPVDDMKTAAINANQSFEIKTV